MKEKNSIIKIEDFMISGLLRALDFKFSGSEWNGSRVLLCFHDPEGKAIALIQEHNTRGVKVNSLDYCDGILWAKGRIFSQRRTAEVK